VNRSVLFVLGGAVVVVVLFFVFRSSGDSSSTDTTTPTTTTTTSTSTTATSTSTSTSTAPQRVVIAIQVKGARPVGGIRHAEVTQGKKVSLVVTSPDTTDEVHLHGYDLHADIEGGKAQIDFTAKIAGRFEAELEQHGVQILDLEVTP
jgi:hypothetical protein